MIAISNRRMLPADPLPKFNEWYAAARACKEIVDASAMALATADLSGRPSVRMVLLKECDERGFVFYTNLDSAKAGDLRQNTRASLCFHWAALRRQIRVQGSVQPVDLAEADAYFATRPRLSQLAAWASKQSRPMEHSYDLELAISAYAIRFGTRAVPRPEHWSGYRVSPEEIEFWEERSFRRHERWKFSRSGGPWDVVQLYP
jgi:pyridoxamine 5'-phosphate oxidase